MIKKLLACVGEYRKPSLLTPVMMIGEVLMETLIPFVMAALIDEGINARDAGGVIVGDVGIVIKYGLLMLLCAFIWTARTPQPSDTVHRKMRNLLHRIAEQRFENPTDRPLTEP